MNTVWRNSNPKKGFSWSLHSFLPDRVWEIKGLSSRMPRSGWCCRCCTRAPAEVTRSIRTLQKRQRHYISNIYYGQILKYAPDFLAMTYPRLELVLFLFTPLLWPLYPGHLGQFSFIKPSIVFPAFSYIQFSCSSGFSSFQIHRKMPGRWIPWAGSYGWWKVNEWDVINTWETVLVR